MQNDYPETTYKKWKWHSATRYYNLVFDRDLFGKWTATRSWGGKFNKIHRYKKEYCTHSEIDNLVAQIHKRRLSRGYNLILN